MAAVGGGIDATRRTMSDDDQDVVNYSNNIIDATHANARDDWTC